MKQLIKNHFLLMRHPIGVNIQTLLIILLLVLFTICPVLQASVVELYAMSSGPTPSMAISNHIVTAIPQSATTLSNVPTSSWTYGL